MSFAFAPFVRALSALLPLLVVGSAHAATSNVGACRPGMTVTDDTAGHCCWAGQAWANRCVGKPSTCPEGMDVKGDACVPTPCPNGQERMTDRWHCCWVGQAWSKSRNQCIGTPDKCPAGTTVDAVSEQCIEKGASAVVQTEARAVPRPPVRPPPQNERTCAPGQAIGPDSDGHCCWPGQAWTDRCIGKPTACPDGWSARRDECVEVPCDSGMERASGHCCWPGQAWSKSRSVCVGTPARCPANTVVDADAELCRPALSPVAPPMPAVRASEGPKCPAGTAIAVDTDGHCCPAAFRWSAAGRVCTRRPDFDHATVEPASAPATPAPSAGLQQGTRGRPPPAKPPTSVGFDASDDTIAQTASTESSAEFEVLPHRVGLHLESLEERTERVDTANLFHLAFGYTGSFSSSGMQIGTTTLGWRHIDPTGFSRAPAVAREVASISGSTLASWAARRPSTAVTTQRSADWRQWDLATRG